MSTCCLMINGEYGCCPYDNGNCCGTHCCPQNFTCGTRIGECIENEYQPEPTFFVNWHRVEILAYPTNKANKNSNDVCSNGITPCSNGTCCLIEAKSSYSCCMFQYIFIACSIINQIYVIKVLIKMELVVVHMAFVVLTITIVILN